MHGLRNPLLSPGVSARQSDPGLERSRLPGQVEVGERTPAQDQQLSGVDGAPLPRALRGLLRARHQPGRGDHQVDRDGDRGTGVRGGLDSSRAPGHSNRQDGGRRRLGAGRPRGGRSVESRRPPGHGVRAVRPHRRAPALRHPRVQDGEAIPDPPPVDHGGRRRQVPAQHRHRNDGAGGCHPAGVRRDAARGRRRTAARPEGPGTRALRRPLRHGVPVAAEPAVRGRRHRR